jgi:hypothetical protein
MQPLIDEALRRWSMSQNTALVDGLRDLEVRIADLPGLELGYMQNGVITIDTDAAGYGWFVDLTPEDQSEFQQRTWDGDWVAMPSSAAFGHMDLLTVVMHELGHVLGLSDKDASTHAHDLMAATLAPGVRRLPETSLIRADETAFHPAVRPGKPGNRDIEWGTEIPLAPVAASDARSTARCHTPRIVWESIEAETRLIEDTPLGQRPWWRRLQRLFRHDTRATHG